jgi:hypothetical protein
MSTRWSSVAIGERRSGGGRARGAPPRLGCQASLHQAADALRRAGGDHLPRQYDVGPGRDGRAGAAANLDPRARANVAASFAGAHAGDPPTDQRLDGGRAGFGNLSHERIDGLTARTGGGEQLSEHSGLVLGEWQGGKAARRTGKWNRNAAAADSTRRPAAGAFGVAGAGTAVCPGRLTAK